MKRSLAQILVQWVGIAGATAALMGCWAVCPRVYVVFWLAVFCGTIGGGALLGLGALCKSNPVGWLFAGDVVKGAVELMLFLARVMLGAGGGY